MRIGILTGGGDTQALNSILYGAACFAEKNNYELIGFLEGWKGTLSPEHHCTLTKSMIKPSKGGTLLLSERVNICAYNVDEAVKNISGKVEALIAIGGDDTLSAGLTVSEKIGMPYVAVTKTVDNDVGINAPSGELDLEKMVNYFTPGFPTAMDQLCKEVNDDWTTVDSHSRIMVVESMGRTAGWLTLSSYSANPDFIIIPEVGLDCDDLANKVSERYVEKRKNYIKALKGGKSHRDHNGVMIVVAEGAKYKGYDLVIATGKPSIDSFGHEKLGGVAEFLADKLELGLKEKIGASNFNAQRPNYRLRSGKPNQLDRTLGIEIGYKAAEVISHGRSNVAVGIKRSGNLLVTEVYPIDGFVKKDSYGNIIPRLVDSRFYDAKNYCITDLGREYFRVMK